MSLQNEDKTNKSTIIYIYCFLLRLDWSCSSICLEVIVYLANQSILTVLTPLSLLKRTNISKLNGRITRPRSCHLQEIQTTVAFVSYQTKYIILFPEKKTRVLSLERVEKLWGTNTRPTLGNLAIIEDERHF